MDLEQYYNRIYTYCYFRIGDRQTAEDITQETFLKFLETADYKDMGKPMAFLYTIARHLCVDWQRNSSTSGRRFLPIIPTLKNSDADGIGEKSIPAFVPSREESITTSLALAHALELLGDEEREIIILRFLHELQPSEIGHMMGISRFAVYRKLKHGLNILKKQLGKEDFH